MPKDQKIDIENYGKVRLTVFIQVSVITLVTMGALGGGGYLLDQVFETSPALFITGLVLAYPLVQIYLYKKFKASNLK